jgi:hypothetical protein
MKMLLLSKFLSMKNFSLLSLIALFCLFAFTVTAQDQPEQLNLPGDNLNLYAVMKLFQESPTLEEFEKKINDPDSKVNNLDLDGDNNIDYIKVVDNVDGAVHNIALKVAVSKTEDQDVAVFVVEKDQDGHVQIQLIGDEDLYGKDYIVEPGAGAPSATPNPGYAGNTAPVEALAPDYEVSSWPVVSFIFVPTYTVWRSPWHWGYYPSYWHPWAPLFWHEYYGYQYHWNYYYRAHYRYTPVYRFPAWRDRYYGGSFRSRSNFVEVRARQGNYRQTYSRPDLANRGSDLFRKDHPTAPSVNRRLPNFDANNNGRPIITHRNTNRPGNNSPGNERPNRPVTNSPGNERPNRPVTRPDNNFPNRPVTRPDNNNSPNRPVTRPIDQPNRPVTRPLITSPETRPHETRPVTSRPSNNPPNNRPVTTRPLTSPPPPRPVNTRPVNANNPVNNRPAVTRPANNPRPQQVRPAPRPIRPANERPREKKDGR